MGQKLVIGGLVLAILAVVGFGLIDAANAPQESEVVLDDIIADVDVDPTLEPTIEATEDMIADAEIVATTQPTVNDATPDPQPVVQANGAMGEAWSSDGTITVLEDFGFTMTTEAGDYYVELGPPTYWQAQDVTLAVGDSITVDGYYNGDQVHAQVVTANGAQLVIRNEAGQPMWAGGADNTHEAGQTSAGNAGQNQLQVSAEDWVTLTGVIGSVTNGNVTLNVDDGSVLNLQMGQPQFWQSQGVTLNVGDPVEVLGFWSGDQFMAGDIRKTETGETIMLRDPNGRQLWAGPGRNGQTNGQTNNGQQSGGQGNNQSGGQNKGQSNNQSGSQSNGNGYRGGRGES